MKKHYYLYVYLEVHLLLFAEDSATKTEVYTQVGRLDNRINDEVGRLDKDITENRRALDERITNTQTEIDNRVTTEVGAS